MLNHHTTRRCIFLCNYRDLLAPKPLATCDIQAECESAVRDPDGHALLIVEKGISERNR